MAETAKKMKKKRWLAIVAPAFLSSEVLGESLVAEPVAMVGKVLETNLMNITHDIKQQAIHVRFKVVSIDSDIAKTELISYEMAPSGIKRMVRREADRLDESTVCETSDNIRIRVKVLLLTKSLSNSNVHGLIRSIMLTTLIKEVKKLTFEQFVMDVITKKIQNTLRLAIKKVYPLKVCEIRSFLLTTDKVTTLKPVAQVKAKAAIEEPEVA